MFTNVKTATAVKNPIAIEMPKGYKMPSPSDLSTDDMKSVATARPTKMSNCP